MIFLFCRNYVIQFVVNLGIEWATSKIVKELKGNFGYLSMQKCGSHVVENCLKQASELDREMIIHELMADPKLPHIMADPFGNFVIQTALKECKVNVAMHPHPNEFSPQFLYKCCSNNCAG